LVVLALGFGMGKGKVGFVLVKGLEGFNGLRWIV